MGSAFLFWELWSGASSEVTRGKTFGALELAWCCWNTRVLSSSVLQGVLWVLHSVECSWAIGVGIACI